MARAEGYEAQVRAFGGTTATMLVTGIETLAAALQHLGEAKKN